MSSAFNLALMPQTYFNDSMAHAKVEKKQNASIDLKLKQ
jgi:hypothetical protein